MARIAKVIPVHPEGNTDVWTKFHCNLSNCCWDISLKTWTCWWHWQKSQKDSSSENHEYLDKMSWQYSRYWDISVWISGLTNRQTNISIPMVTLLAWLKILVADYVVYVCVSTCIRWRTTGWICWLVQRRTGSGQRGDGLQFIKHMRLTAAELWVAWRCCATASCNNTEWECYVMMMNAMMMRIRCNFNDTRGHSGLEIIGNSKELYE